MHGSFAPHSTLGALLADRAAREPDREALVLIAEDGSRERLTVAEIHGRAASVAQGMRGLGVEPGQVCLLALGHGTELITTFLGALYAGGAPAILPYVRPKLDATAYGARLRRLADASNARLVVTTAALRDAFGDALAGLSCRVVDAPALRQGADAPALDGARVTADDLAFVQFTSGTTGVQKVVGHTHRAVVAFLHSKGERLWVSGDDVAVNWLPLYHDLGLVAACLMPLMLGARVVLMSPFHWARDPKILLHAIHEFRGTLCWMPNAGLSHCARTIKDGDLEGVDLSCWRLLGCGGEPVRLTALQTFEERFRRYGFRYTALHVGYGMAEHIESMTTSATGEKDSAVPIDWVRQRDLQDDGRAVPGGAGETGCVPVVSCGPPFRGVELRILDAGGRALPERHIGEIAVRSAYVLSGGYLGRPDLTEAALHDGWFHTGDVGYLAGGHLYVCGRKKDLLKVGGRRVYPEDLEAMGGAVPGVAEGRVVAFGVEDERSGTDRVVLVCEVRSGTDALEVTRELRRRAARELDVTVGDVRIVPAGWILKSSSGKLARAANREKFLAEPRAQETP